MDEAGPHGGAQHQAATITDDFAGLSGWRQGRFRLDAAAPAEVG